MFQTAKTKWPEHVQKDRGVAGESREATAIRSDVAEPLKFSSKALKMKGA